MNKNLLYSVKIFLLCILIMTGCIIKNAYGQTTLTAGDLAIIGIKTNNNSQSGNDAIKLMTMVDLTCGTQFVVTDNNWRNSTNSWYCNDDEFAIEVTVTSKICAGSIIYIDVASSGGSISSSSGSLTKSSLGNPWGTDYGLSSGGDNVFILGPDSPTGSQRTSPTFIFGIKHNGAFADLNCSTGANPKDNSGKPSSLTLGTTAIEMSSSKDQWHYNCSNTTSGTKATLLAAIADKTKWRNNTTESWNTGTCTFTVTDPCTAPVHKASSFNSSSITQTTATISWSNCPSPGTNPGNTKVLVIARSGTPVATDPTSGNTYTANAAFGSGSAIGAGFVVYDGIGTSINLTGLTAGTTYYFSVYEYSCTGNCYNIDDLPGSITTSAPLLVDLLYFHAVQKNNLMEFEWLTLSEKDHDHFEIEGSIDGINFKTIGNVKGIGNSQEIQQYSYAYFMSEALYYFRLKEIDVNNQIQYSTIEKIANEQSEVELFPIPASEELFVRFTNSEKTIIIILDLSGKELYTAVDLSGDVHTLDLRSLHSGTYLLSIQNARQNTCKKFYKW